MQNLESAQDHLPPLTLTALERACSYIFQEDHRLTGFGADDHKKQLMTT